MARDAWRRRKRRRAEAKADDNPDIRLKAKTARQPKDSKDIVRLASFAYHVRQDVDVDEFLQRKVDLHIVDLTDLFATQASLPAAKCVFGRLDDEFWAQAYDGKGLDEAIDSTLSQLKKSSIPVHGLAISTRILDAWKLSDLLHKLVETKTDVILIESSDNPVATDLLPLSCGILYENACILPNGFRRDFFQAAKLRKALGQSTLEKEIGADYFVGFLDLWNERPHPATIRRSVKFAKFHDAVLYQASASGLDKSAPFQECLGAFDLLKGEDIIDVSSIPYVYTLTDTWQMQKNWVNTAVPDAVDGNVTDHATSLAPVIQLLPELAGQFCPIAYQSLDHGDYEPKHFIEPIKYALDAPPRKDYFAESSLGKPLSFRGCYDLREEMFDEQYLCILDAQLHLRRLEMSTQLPSIEMDKVIKAIAQVPRDSACFDLAQELLQQITEGRLEVHQGLDTGFTLPDLKGHFWSVSHDEEDKILIFISLKTPDLPSTILHTYLAHKGIPRVARLECEMAMFEAISAGSTHPRLDYELANAAYSELLTMVQQLSIAGARHPILDYVRSECRRLLVLEPSRRAWVRLNSKLLLAGKITPLELFETRLKYLWTRGYDHLPNAEKLAQAYDDLANAIILCLYQQKEEELAVLMAPLSAQYGPDAKKPFDVTIDFYGLMVFCILRKYAFEEVYLECTDRCPLFLQQPDQAGVFSELWVLGSQCEIYFGIRPKALGAIIYDRYRKYLQIYEPPVSAWNNQTVFTAYQKIEATAEKPPTQLGKFAQRSAQLKATFIKTGFLAIFCLPAIIDVGLLTFLGRGLYLTAFMTLEERVMANYALLASLIMTAGITGWSGSIGGFYLYQSAFQNMNYFMVQRLSGGFVLASIVSIGGFFRFGTEYSWYAGVIFVAYIMVLSTYLNLLGIMATMHRDGSPFPSGRGVFGKCLTITLISPVVTSFVNNHDVAIYLPVLYLFLVVLIWEWSKLCHEWTSWPEKVVITKEADIVAWHQERLKAKESSKGVPVVEEAQVRGPPKTAADLAAEALGKAIESGQTKPPKNLDPYLAKMIPQHKFVLWILKKESGDAPLPPPYTTSWLVQTKLALASQQQLNRGLKEHSPFLLFRYAKYDLAQNVGLFLLALLDRWVSISMSANGYVVDQYYDARARYGIAFGLLYFLMCAICLDIVLQRYWGKTGRQSAKLLRNIFDLEEATEKESHVQKKRWLTAFTELASVMFCILGLQTVFVFLFVSEGRQVISYYAYVVAYSGVILSQFNRVFTTDIRKHVHIVFLGSALGYFVGVVLHEIPATRLFPYVDVIALCTASMTSAYGTWLYTDFCDDAEDEIHLHESPQPQDESYAQRLIGYDNDPAARSHSRLEGLGSSRECLYDDKSTISDGLRTLLDKALQRISKIPREDLPLGESVLRQSLQAWINGDVSLNIVTRNELIAAGFADRFATSYKDGDVLGVYVGMPSIEECRITEEAWLKLLIQVLAEALVHETCEGLLGMSHAESTVHELLLNSADISTRMALQLAWTDEAKLQSIVYRSNAELLRHLAFNIDVDVAWESEPENIRAAIFSRVACESYTMTCAIEKWFKNCSTRPLQSLDVSVRQCLSIYKVAQWRSQLGGDPTKPVELQAELGLFPWHLERAPPPMGLKQTVMSSLLAIYDFAFLSIEFVAITTTAGTDLGKELFYTIRHSRVRSPAIWTILKFWKVCSWLRKGWTRLVILPYKPVFKKYHVLYKKGIPRVLSCAIITVHDPVQASSGFLEGDIESPELHIFDGIQVARPRAAAKYTKATYSPRFRLKSLQNMTIKDRVENLVEQHEFTFDTADKKRKYPLYKTTTAGTVVSKTFYDDLGRISHGTCARGGRDYQFSYTFEDRTGVSNKLLKATYLSVDQQAPTAYTVSWCTPRDANTIDPREFSVSERVQRVIRTTADKNEETSWDWSHKRDPVITRKSFSSAGELLLPPEIGISVKDELGIFAKPKVVSFQEEDLLFYHSAHSIRREYSRRAKALSKLKKSESQAFVSARTSEPSKDDDKTAAKTAKWYDPTLAYVKSCWWFFNEMKYVKRLNNLVSPIIHHKPKTTHYVPMPTWKLRTCLWKEWMATTDLDACTCCLLDEEMLRFEPLLHEYWKLRDAGYFAESKQYLYDNMHAIVAAIELMDDVAAKVSLSIRMSDLFVMGLSKDANFVTPAPEKHFIDTDNRLAVIFTDTGCWPDAPGGVSNCRRDLIDGHTTIRNYALSESANEFGIPRFQCERSIQAIKNLPLWGLDGKSPSHGLLDNLLQMQVENRLRNTTTRDIEERFIPLLKSYIRGARTHEFSKADLIHFTKVVLKMNKYFEDHDYLKSWQCKETRQAFKEAWLQEYDDPNIRNPNDCFAIEQPTAQNFDEAMGLYISYFFILSVKIPEVVPRVYQSTHHGISSLWGMCLKLRRGTSWGIWDHAILWRETCLNISVAQCILPVSVQTMLLGAMKLAAHLAYMHADTILPCTAVYNPIWEVELGTDEGRRQSQNIFLRKIDPVTNGISSMDAFKPVEKIKSEHPTAVMLSNVQFIKDVKNAILAASVIINDFGFKTYHLTVYGAQDREPSYAIKTASMISDLGISKTVKLGGFGRPAVVLQEAWLFMNSSLSEGLPLAIGEAALSGCPIVATEVGATAQVLTDVYDPNIRYGEVVPPNDPVALARAQIAILAMVGPWAKYTTDDVPPGPLPSKFTPADVERLTKRMHDKTEDRRRLGLKLREVVLAKFNGNRYLREHEQMYWAHRHLAEQRADPVLHELARQHPGYAVTPKFVEDVDAYERVEQRESLWDETVWQEFPKRKELYEWSEESEVEKIVVDDEDVGAGQQQLDEKS